MRDRVEERGTDLSEVKAVYSREPVALGDFVGAFLMV